LGLLAELSFSKGDSQMEKEKKEVKHKQSLIIPFTAILIAIIIGGSIFATEYYKQKSYEKQQQTKLEAEDKAKKDEAAIESQQKRGLQTCLTKADTDYWAYMETNGTKKANDVIWAEDKYWDYANRVKQDTIDNCNEQYKNKSFQGLYIY